MHIKPAGWVTGDVEAGKVTTNWQWFHHDIQLCSVIYNDGRWSSAHIFIIMKREWAEQPSLLVPLSLKSSTRMISAMSCGGERLRTLWTVRSRDDQPSLWKGMMMLVVGRSSAYSFVLQLHTHTHTQLQLHALPSFGTIFIGGGKIYAQLFKSMHQILVSEEEGSEVYDVWLHKH